MFEKLKEFSLYIIIWLIWLWTLAYVFINTNNTQKWWVVLTKIHEWILSWITKTKTIKNVTTIVDHLQDQNWLNLWEYILDTTKIYLSNTDWDNISTQIDVNHNWKLFINTYENTLKKWKIWLYLITDKQIWNENWEYILTKKSITKNWVEISSDVESDKKNFIWINEWLRWYLFQWYIWFWTFQNLEDAKKFRDSYFSNWIVLQSDNNQFAIFVRM